MAQLADEERRHLLLARVRLQSCRIRALELDLAEARAERVHAYRELRRLDPVTTYAVIAESAQLGEDAVRAAIRECDRRAAAQATPELSAEPLAS